MEKTFVMIKPTAIQRNLVGEIIKRLEQKGLILCALKMINVSKEQANKHYDVHQDKPFFGDLVRDITAGPVIAMIWSGNNAVEIVRLVAGATNPKQALPGTIRGDFSIDMGLNLIHSADAVDRAKYEMSIYFDENEILDYDKVLNKHTYSE